MNGWHFAGILGGLVAIATFFGLWRGECRRNAELRRALRVYLRDSRDPRDDRDRRCVERRRAFIAELIALKPGELAPEWAPQEDAAKLKVVRSGKR